MPLAVASPSAGARTGLRMSCMIWRSSTASNWRETSATLAESETFGLLARDSRESLEASMRGWAPRTFILSHDEFGLQRAGLFHGFEHRHHVARGHAQRVERLGH